MNNKDIADQEALDALREEQIQDALGHINTNPELRDEVEVEEWDKLTEDSHCLECGENVNYCVCEPEEYKQAR